tara:strand:- start:83 stop:1396 length:1314 start_codon:yes stop_codon:yes gene_type:complete
MVQGAVLQLAARGEQNKYLTGNPQMSYFVSVYRRHTNFTFQDIRNFFDGTIDFGKVVTCKLSSIGDLVGQLIVRATLPNLDELNTDPTRPVSWINAVGHALIKEYSIFIGEKEIEKQYGMWLEIWSELTISDDKRAGYNLMVGKHNVFNNNLQTGQLSLYIPLRFWFCRNIGLSLPLIALQRQDVRLRIQFSKANELITANRPYFYKPLINADLLVRYYFLDDAERKIFARRKHTYLIEQLQVQTESKKPDMQTSLVGGTLTSREIFVEIPFNHPVKEIIWVVQRTDCIYHIDNTIAPPEEHWNNAFNFSNVPQPLSTTGNLNPVLFTNFRIEGTYYFQEEEDVPVFYFRIVQPQYRHSRTPVNRYIYLYSFSLNPEEYQPSGSYNFSKIDHRFMRLFLNPINTENTDTNEYNINVFATNYNLLTIEGGMGFIEYSA